MKKRFDKKVVIVTGASSGIGASTAKLFAKEGAITVLVARTEAKLLEVSDDIQKNGGTSLIIPTDISMESQVNDMVERVYQKFGRIDLLFNNAGTSHVGTVASENFVPDLKDMMRIDLLGTVFCVKAVLPIMKTQGHGHIINMSSVVGLKSFARFTGYSSIMHAITGFTDGLRQELQDTGIRVSIIHPALTQTSLLDHIHPKEMPKPFKVMTPIHPSAVAKKLVEGILKSKRKIIVPFQPKVLLFFNALSVQLGDWFVRLISNLGVSRLLGMYKGRLYHDQITD